MRSHAFIFILVWFCVVTGSFASSPVSIHQECTRREVHIYTNPSNTEHNTYVYKATRISVYFDQPLYFSGSRSFEYIYSRGADKEVALSLKGVQLCCSSTCFRLESDGPIFSSASMFDGYAFFLPGPLRTQIHTSKPSIAQLRSVFAQSATNFWADDPLPQPNEIVILVVTPNSEIKFDSCKLNIEDSSISNMNKETVGIRSDTIECIPRLTPLINLVNSSQSSWTKSLLPFAIRKLEDTKDNTISFLEVEESRNSDSIPSFIEEEDPTMFLEKYSIQWRKCSRLCRQRRAQELKKNYEDAVLLEIDHTEDPNPYVGDSPKRPAPKRWYHPKRRKSLFSSRRHKVTSDIDPNNWLPWWIMGKTGPPNNVKGKENVKYTTIQEIRALAKPSGIPGGKGAQYGRSSPGNEAGIDPVTGLPWGALKPPKDQALQAGDSSSGKPGTSADDRQDAGWEGGTKMDPNTGLPWNLLGKQAAGKGTIWGKLHLEDPRLHKALEKGPMQNLDNSEGQYDQKELDDMKIWQSWEMDAYEEPDDQYPAYPNSDDADMEYDPEGINDPEAGDPPGPDGSTFTDYVKNGKWGIRPDSPAAPPPPPPGVPPPPPPPKPTPDDPAQVGVIATQTDSVFKGWCDLHDPFQNPFCPFPLPFFVLFNLVLKTLIPGICAPVVDNLAAEFIAGQQAPLELVEKILLQTNMDTPGTKGIVKMFKAFQTASTTPQSNFDAVHPFPHHFKSSSKIDQSEPSELKKVSAAISKQIKGQISDDDVLKGFKEHHRSDRIPSPGDFPDWEDKNKQWADLDKKLTERFFTSMGLDPSQPQHPIVQAFTNRKRSIPIAPRSLLPKNHVPLRIAFEEEMFTILHGKPPAQVPRMQETRQPAPEPTPDNTIKEARIKSPPEPQIGVALIPLLKMTLFKELVHPLTNMLAASITRDMTAAAVPPLFDALIDDLKEFLKISLTHSLTHTLTATLPLTLGVTVPEVLESVMPVHLIIEMTSSLTNTLTRGITHALSLTLVQVLGKSQRAEYYCYYCFQYKQFCEKCERNDRKEDTFASLYYTEWFASYYTDYYAPYYAWGVFPLLKLHPLGVNEG